MLVAVITSAVNVVSAGRQFYTVSSENDTDAAARYNCDAHRLILVIFGRDVAE